MADLRPVDGNATRRVTQLAPDSGRQQHDHQPQRERSSHGAPPGAEELALALADGGRAAMEARYELAADGSPRIRIVDTARAETIAVLTPEELKAMTESTGLPPGLLIRRSS